MKIKKFFLVLSVCIAVCLCVNNSAYAQSMKLVIGQYECTSNAGCSDGYCDIDTHKCINCPECESCPDVPECKTGWSLVNNVCKECVSDDDCTGSKPRCVSNQCVSCPSNRPVWNGEYCDCKDGEINLDGTCVKCVSSADCPDDKPVCNTVSHKCEVCPSDKPYWNGTICDCNEGYYSLKGKCLKLRECFDNLDCKDTNKPVCNTTTGMCEPCPTTRKWWTGTKCVQCRNYNDCKDNGNNHVCNIYGDCEPCAAATPIWTGSKCIECTSYTDCANKSGQPNCNTTKNVCEACPTNTKWHNNTCTPLYTVTVRNMDDVWTTSVVKGGTYTLPASASYYDLSFSHWQSSATGKAVSGNQTINANVTFYAYYETPETILKEDQRLNINNRPYIWPPEWGGYTSYSYTPNTYGGKVQYRFISTEQRFAYNNNGGMHCWDPGRDYCLYVDDVDMGCSATCAKSDWYIGTGKTLTVKLSEENNGDRKGDLIWRLWFKFEPIIQYPY